MAAYNKNNTLDSFKTFIDSLNSDSKARIFVAAGEEEFFIDRLIERAKSMISEDMRDFNFSLIYGEEHSVEKVINSAREFPMMSEFRVVIVKNLQQLQGFGAKSSQELFKSYLDAPNPSSFLILTDSKNINKKSSLGKKLTKDQAYVRFFESSRIAEHSLSSWLMYWASNEHNKKLAPDAAEILWNLSGNDLTQLTAELSKLTNYVGERDQISFSDVKELVGQHKSFTLFEIKDALIQGNSAKALQMAKQQMELFNSSGEVIKLLNILFSTFVMIWQVHMFMHRRLSMQQAANESGINQWILKRAWSEAAQIPVRSLPLIMEALLDMDKAIKGMGNHKAEGVMYMCLKRISSAINRN